jgi:hypothetical protein
MSPRSRWFEDRLRPSGAKPVSDALCPLREPIGHRTGRSAGIVAGSAGCHTRPLHTDGGAAKRICALGGASWWFKPQGPFIPMPRTIPQSADGQVATAHNGRRLSTVSVIQGAWKSNSRRLYRGYSNFGAVNTGIGPQNRLIPGGLLFRGISFRNANVTSVTLHRPITYLISFLFSVSAELFWRC